MRILYDNEIFGLQRMGGASNYYVNLIKHLQPEFEIITPQMYSNNIYLKDIKKDSLKQKSFLFSKFYYRMMNNKFNMDLIKAKCYDVFHHTYYDNYFINDFGSDRPLVITIHDMVHEIYPELSKFSSIITKNKKQLVQRADKIIAISEKTKLDLCYLFNVKEEKIEVVYHGTDFTTHCNKNLIKDLPQNYILYVGKRDGYKNFSWTIKNLAADLLNRNIKLICVGASFTFAERRLIEDLQLNKLVICRTVNSSIELQEIYGRAIFFVYPSLYEGFGIPILEAFASRVPILLSRCSCFPEIAKDSAAYFSECNSEEFRFQVGKLLDQESYRDELINSGCNRLELFSWKKSALKTAGIYSGLK